ncbi:MAG: putative Ig domain-containing protein, partial [Nanoarchaeota archaeon]
MSKKRSLLSLLGAGLVGFTSLFSGNDAKAVDDIEILTYGDNSQFVSGSAPYIVRTANGIDLSGDDTLWSSQPPSQNLKFLKLFTNPYGMELYGDVRSLNSSLFQGKIMAVDEQDSQAFLPALTSKVEFNIRDNSSTNNYITRFNLPAQYAQDNQGFTHITNITQGLISPNFNLKSLQSGTIGAFVDISMTPKSQTASGNEDTLIFKDLSANQVSGLTYQIVTQPTNGNAVISGNNLTYTPNANYNGADYLKYNLLWVNGTTTNNLGDVAYNLTVNSVNDAPVVANAVGNKSAQYGSSFSFSVPSNTFSDVDGNALTYSVNGLPSGITFNTGSTNFTGTPTASGIYPVNLIATDTGGLKATNTFNLDVAKASLSVTADPKIRNYGASNPAPTFTFSGLKNSDPITASGTVGANLTSGVGSYAITIDSLTDSNNKLTNYNSPVLSSGTLTINPASLTVTAGNTS